MWTYNTQKNILLLCTLKFISRKTLLVALSNITIRQMDILILLREEAWVEIWNEDAIDHSTIFY